VRISDWSELPPGAKIERVIAFGASQVKIRCLESDGTTPLASTTCFLEFGEQRGAGELRTDAQGWLVLDAVPAGTVLVRCCKEPWATAQRQGMDHAAWQASAVTLEPVVVVPGGHPQTFERRLHR
jgi:hypothetical protein